MKMIALLGAAELDVGGIAATPAEAQYHHGYHGGYGHHGGNYRAYNGRHGYRYGGYRRGWHGYGRHRVVCNRFGRCHRI